MGFSELCSSFGKVWDTVHPTENLWDVLLLMSTKCSASQKKRRERQDDWKTRWKIGKWSLFPTSCNIKKTKEKIQGKDPSLPNTKHFAVRQQIWQKWKTQQVLIFKQLYAVYVPCILMETDFQRLRFMGWWFNAEYRCTFQACHHILPQALSSVTGQCC